MLRNIEIKEVLIRDHLADVDRLMKGLQESEVSLFSKSAPWADIRSSYLRHLMDVQEKNEGTCLIAYTGSRAVGFIFAYLEVQDNSRSEVDTGPELYVSDGYVDPNYRRQGIYKNLNRRLEEKYRAAGVRRITRFTLMNNEAMKHLIIIDVLVVREVSPVK